MELREIQELMRCFDASGLTALELSGEGTSLRMEKGGAARPAAPLPQAATAETAPAPVPPAARATVEITAPMVGVAYAAPSPDAQPYIQLGQRVEKGQTLCLMEAMKMMNEIPAEMDGTVVEICVGNGQVVEYNQPLFRISQG